MCRVSVRVRVEIEDGFLYVFIDLYSQPLPPLTVNIKQMLNQCLTSQKVTKVQKQREALIRFEADWCNYQNLDTVFDPQHHTARSDFISSHIPA